MTETAAWDYLKSHGAVDYRRWPAPAGSKSTEILGVMFPAGYGFGLYDSRTADEEPASLPGLADYFETHGGPAHVAHKSHQEACPEGCGICQDIAKARQS